MAWLPGNYQLVAQLMDFDAVAATGGSAGLRNPEQAIEDLVVSGEDMPSITLVTTAGGTAQGVVRFDTGARRPPPRRRRW